MKFGIFRNFRRLPEKLRKYCTFRVTLIKISEFFIIPRNSDKNPVRFGKKTHFTSVQLDQYKKNRKTHLKQKRRKGFEQLQNSEIQRRAPILTQLGEAPGPNYFWTPDFRANRSCRFSFHFCVSSWRATKHGKSSCLPNPQMTSPPKSFQETLPNFYCLVFLSAFIVFSLLPARFACQFAFHFVADKISKIHF